MKPHLQKRFSFIGKSLLWSFLLYLTVMLCFNWDDVRNASKGKNEVTISNAMTDEARNNVAAHSGVAKGIVTILKVISGITVKSSDN